MRITVCEAADVPRLLPDALAGRFVLAPVGVGKDAELEMLRPDIPEDSGAAVIVATSGSTGHPKGVMLSAEALLAASAANREFLGTTPGRWHVVLPMNYVAGLMVVVRALDAGHPPVMAGRIDDLVAIPGEMNFTSLVPTQLHRVVQLPALTERLARFDAVLVGGAAAGGDLLDRAREAGIRVVTTYGMSETCGGVVYDGVPLPGVGVRLGERGRITLTGPTLMSGYRLRPDLTEQVLTGGGVLTHDWGEWTDGRLRVGGRLDDIVISGGVNVDLAEVQRRVEERAVEVGGASAVVGLPDDEWGTQIVLVTTSDRDVDWWRDRLAGTLAREALPRRVVRVATLPMTASGKMDRQQLAALAAAR